MPDILVTTRDSIGVISLNRPRVRNAVTLGMWRELASIFSSLADDDAVRAIVLTGSGADFCVGADVSEFATKRPPRFRGRWMSRVGARVSVRPSELFGEAE